MDISDAVANAVEDSVESTIGTTPHLYFYSGTKPDTCGDTDSNPSLAIMILPSDWLADASARVKALAGTWAATATATGTITHFRIYESTDTTCHLQGTVTTTGGGGDIELASVNAVIDSDLTITDFGLGVINH